MRIVFVTTGLDRAGAEMQIRDLAVAYTARNHSVTVISLTRPKALVQDFAHHAIALHDLGLDAAKKSPVSFILAIFTARRLIQQLRPDIVHAHMVHANLFSRLARALGGWPPLICTAHNIHEGGRLRDWAYRLTNSFSSLNTTISKAATERFVSDRVFPAGTTLTVRNGIDVSKFQPRAARTMQNEDAVFRWICVGRLHEQKDYPTLLRAMAQVPNCSLSIYGVGALLASLHNLTGELGLGDRVQFLGAKDGIEFLMPNYDGFVLASAWEGFGLVVAEAMACELPVVATRSGGPQEILGETESAGFLVDPRAPAALARAMQRMMALPEAERRGMGKAGRQRVVEQFSIDSVADRWLEIYGDLAQRKAPQ
jgi:glycosyltransferase involved in cell wall biosynthesis